MITLDQAKEIVQSYGIAVPDVILQSFVDSVNAKEACLLGRVPAYSAATILMIELYTVAVLALAMGGRTVTSEGAPSGASRSFQIAQSAIKGLKSSIYTLDADGCMADLLATATAGTLAEFKVIRS